MRKMKHYPPYSIAGFVMPENGWTEGATFQRVLPVIYLDDGTLFVPNTSNWDPNDISTGTMFDGIVDANQDDRVHIFDAYGTQSWGDKHLIERFTQVNDKVFDLNVANFNPVSYNVDISNSVKESWQGNPFWFTVLKPENWEEEKNISIGGRKVSIQQLRDEEKEQIEAISNVNKVAPDDFNIYGIQMTRGYVEDGKIFPLVFVPKFHTPDAMEVIDRLEKFFFDWAIDNILDYKSFNERLKDKYFCPTGNPIDLMGSIVASWEATVRGMGDLTNDDAGGFLYNNQDFDTDNQNFLLGMPAKNYLIFPENAEDFMFGALNRFLEDPETAPYWNEYFNSLDEWEREKFAPNKYSVYREYEILSAPVTVELWKESEDSDEED